MEAYSVSCEVGCYGVGTSARSSLETGASPWGLGKLRGGQYTVRVGSPSSWKGARHTGGRRGERTSHPKGGDSAIQRGKGELMEGMVRAVGGCDRRLDLGLQDAPRSTIYRDQTNR